MNPEPAVTIERIDDFGLLIGAMLRLHLPEIINRHLPRHHLEQGLSWGWVATIWLAHILSQSDHRKMSVRDWVRQVHAALERLTGLSIRDTDFTDDRLGILLRHLSQPELWSAIEQDLNADTIRVYDLEPKVIRTDGTTVSGYHAEREAGLFQFGKSKDDPTRPQIKIMQATLDPLGMPLVTEVVRGEKADDGLYVPVIERVIQMIPKAGLLFAGDCKMSALVTRTYIQEKNDYYLSPLAMIGKNPEDIEKWIEEALQRKGSLPPSADPHAQGETAGSGCGGSLWGDLQPIYDTNAKGETVLIAHAYETQRSAFSNPD